MVIFAVIVVAVRPQIATGYSAAVLRIVLWMVPSPSVAPYANHLESGLRVMIAGAMAVLPLVLPASPGRRLAMALHSVVYLVMAVLLDSLVVTTSAVTRLPIAYVGIEGIVLNMLLWATVMLRVFFTTFVLPRPSQVPVVRSAYRVVTIQAVMVAGAALGVLVLATAVILNLGSLGHSLFLLLGFMTYALVWAVFILLLRIFALLQRPPPLGRRRPRST